MQDTELAGKAKARGFYSTRPHTLGAAWDSLPPAGTLAANAEIGPYRLKSKLGEGGMGVVWLAEQREPFQREVAVKLLSQKLKGGLAEAYFQVERQALAQLQHPFIAQIYDAGTLPDGTLFFAMEHIQGVTLDYFAERQAKSLDPLIEITIRICEGVHYAHQRGLIHRDLKPSNVLVIEVGANRLPKIIDFGVAVGMSGGTRSHVDQGQTVGTFAYMAPEQAEPTAAGIDARADVYALGALLGECICLKLGIKPDAPESTARSLRAGMIQSLGGFDSDGLMSSDRLTRELKEIPHGLRAIVLKATHSERADRYDSAAALGDDLARYRRHQPLRAIPQSRLYSLTCFVRRNRLATAAAVAISMALVIGIVVALFGLREAQSARALAEDRRANAEKLIGYMLGDFANKLRPLGKLDLLDGISAQAMAYLGDPAIADDTAVSALRRGTALRTLGEVHAERSQSSEARQAFEESDRLLATISQPEPTAEVLLERGTTAYWLGNLDYQAGNLDAAEQQFVRYLRFSEAAIPLTAASQKGELEAGYANGNLAVIAAQRRDHQKALAYVDAAISKFRDISAQRSFDPEISAELSNWLSWRGRILESQGDLANALESYQQQLTLIEATRRNDPNAALWRSREGVARQWLGLMHTALGDDQKALEQFMLARDAAALVSKHDQTNLDWIRDLAFCEFNLGLLRARQNMTAQARQHFVAADSLMTPLAVGADAAQSFVRLLARTRLALGELNHANDPSSPPSALILQATTTLESAYEADPKDPIAAVTLARARMLLAKIRPAERARALKTIGQLLTPLKAHADPYTVDARARLALLKNDRVEFASEIARLDAMNYQDTEFRAFVAANQGELQ